MYIPDINNLRGRQFTENHFRIHYPEMYNYLNSTYPSDISFQEKIYWFYNEIYTYPLCSQCGNRLKFINVKEGYTKYCCRKCMNSDPLKKEQVKNTNMKRYGGVAPACSPDIKKKTQDTLIERYGVDNIAHIEGIQEKIKNTIIERYGGQGNASPIIKAKYDETVKERYGVDNVMKSEEMKQRLKGAYMNKYGVDSYSKTDEFLEKIYNTKSNNNSFNKSHIEEAFKKWLDENNINYIYQYKSNDYPFLCDFYFPDIDTYLEINAMWTHGNHPYDSNSIDDINILKTWKIKSETSNFYRNAIKVWTISDPRKKKVAEDNKLRWFASYTNNIDELIEYYKTKIIF